MNQTYLGCLRIPFHLLFCSAMDLLLLCMQANTSRVHVCPCERCDRCYLDAWAFLHMVLLSLCTALPASQHSLPFPMAAFPLHPLIQTQTLGTFRQGGCSFAVPAVLALGAANTLYAAQMAWRNAPIPQSPSTAALMGPSVSPMRNAMPSGRPVTRTL